MDGKIIVIEPTKVAVPKKARFRFTLRTLWIAVTVSGVMLAWFGWRLHQARQQQRAVEQIVKVGGYIEFDFYHQAGGTGTPRGFALLRRWLGPHYFDRVDLVSLSPVHHMDGRVDVPTCTDEELAMVQKLPGLRRLGISNTNISDEAMKHIGRARGIEGLTLHGTQITDRGITHLALLSNLKSLTLHGTSVTDDGLKHLHSCERLQSVSLGGPGVTPDGVGALQAALPTCEITYYEEMQ